MLNQVVIQQEAEKLGLTVSPGELSDVLFGTNPPQWMQQAFTDPKTGTFNAQMAKQQFAALKSRPNDAQVKIYRKDILTRPSYKHLEKIPGTHKRSGLCTKMDV